MNKAEFLQAGTHFVNFPAEQLDDVINWSEVYELPNDEHNQRRILLLSQYMVGNVSGTFEEIAELGLSEKRWTFQTWIEILAENQHKQLCHDLVQNLLR